MSKWKQPTLFSLKSWSKVSIEDIKKLKATLEIPSQKTSEILECLHRLKIMKPSLDTILLCGLDKTLKKLLEHRSHIIKSTLQNLEEVCKIGLVSNQPTATKNQTLVFPKQPVANKPNIMKQAEVVEKQILKQPVQSVEKIVDTKPCNVFEVSVVNTSKLTVSNGKENKPKELKSLKLKKDEWDILASEVGLQVVLFYVSSCCEV